MIPFQRPGPNWQCSHSMEEIRLVSINENGRFILVDVSESWEAYMTNLHPLNCNQNSHTYHMSGDQAHYILNKLNFISRR